MKNSGDLRGTVAANDVMVKMAVRSSDFGRIIYEYIGCLEIPALGRRDRRPYVYPRSKPYVH